MSAKASDASSARPWGCGKCGAQANWATRTVCRGCGGRAPTKVLRAAEAAKAGAAAQGKAGAGGGPPAKQWAAPVSKARPAAGRLEAGGGPSAAATVEALRKENEELKRRLGDGAAAEPADAAMEPEAEGAEALTVAQLSAVLDALVASGANATVVEETKAKLAAARGKRDGARPPHARLRIAEQKVAQARKLLGNKEKAVVEMQAALIKAQLALGQAKTEVDASATALREREAELASAAAAVAASTSEGQAPEARVAAVARQALALLEELDGVASVGAEVAAASGPLLQWLKSAAVPQGETRVQPEEAQPRGADADDGALRAAVDMLERARGKSAPQPEPAKPGADAGGSAGGDVAARDVGPLDFLLGDAASSASEQDRFEQFRKRMRHGETELEKPPMFRQRLEQVGASS